jgi:hypothetical protein
MAVSTDFFGNFAKKLAEAEINWVSDTIKLALYTSSLAPDINTDTYLADVSGYDTYEVSTSGTGYSQKTLSSKTNTTSGGNASLDAADIVWSSATFTARYAVIFKDTGNPATSIVIGLIDFGADISVSSGDFTLTWDVNGVVYFSPPA